MTQHLGRPRDKSIDEKVLSTTLELLQAYGYNGLRINDVARHSGIAKTTIYRRWPSLAHLAIAAVEQALGERSTPNTGDLDQDLDQFIATYADLFDGGKPTLMPIGLDIHRQNDPELKAIYKKTIIDPISHQIIALAKRAKIPPHNPQDLSDAIIGGLIYRSVLLGESMQASDIKGFIVNLLCDQPTAHSATATHHDQ